MLKDLLQELQRRPATIRPWRERIQAAGTLLVGVAAGGALIFSALSINATHEQLQIAQQGQYTDRYNAAITNLGSSSVDVRLGGIYALQRIMQDSPRDQSTVAAVLCAFVRDHADAATAKSADSSASQNRLQASGPPRTDIQAALTVVGTRNTAHDGSTTVVDLNNVDLFGADLANAHLSGADLVGADLVGADLVGAYLTGANLSGANLTQADLTADLTGANLANADLWDADLRLARLTGANLSGANLRGADLTGADLTGADLTSATLFGADLANAHLSAANLTYAILYGARLTGANLTDANLTHAAFAHADLTGADLTAANQTGTGFFGAHLTGAKGLRTDTSQPSPGSAPASAPPQR